MLKPGVTAFSSAARTATANSNTMAAKQHRGVVLFLEITAASGTTPTLDVKLQMFDDIGEQWHDIPGAAFAQKTGTGRDALMLYPGIGETANKEVSVALPPKWRAVATIAGTTPSFTFSLAGFYLP